MKYLIKSVYPDGSSRYISRFSVGPQWVGHDDSAIFFELLTIGPNSSVADILDDIVVCSSERDAYVLLAMMAALGLNVFDFRVVCFPG